MITVASYLNVSLSYDGNSKGEKIKSLLEKTNKENSEAPSLTPVNPEPLSSDTNTLTDLFVPTFITNKSAKNNDALTHGRRNNVSN